MASEKRLNSIFKGCNFIQFDLAVLNKCCVIAAPVRCYRERQCSRAISCLKLVALMEDLQSHDADGLFATLERPLKYLQ